MLVSGVVGGFEVLVHGVAGSSGCSRGAGVILDERRFDNGMVHVIDGELAGPLMTTIARVARAVKRMCNADGVSIRQNNERHGGQDVFHDHFHVVPRFADDGFVTLDRSLGAIEVPIEQRVEQAQKMADASGCPRGAG